MPSLYSMTVLPPLVTNWSFGALHATLMRGMTEPSAWINCVVPSAVSVRFVGAVIENGDGSVVFGALSTATSSATSQS